MACNTKTDKLQFSEFEIKDENGKTAITVSNNGTITISGKTIGTINKDGTLNDIKGNLLAKLNDANILEDKDGKNLTKIDENGVIDNGSGTYIKWNKEGDFIKGSTKTGLTMTPAAEKSFQSASIILFLYLNISVN